MKERKTTRFEQETQCNWGVTNDDHGLPLPQNLGYVALSYAWGDPTSTTRIEVNGVQVSVTSSLEAALRALRGKSFIRQGGAVWADALCIDQSNLSERSKEVRRMREIYRNADSVVVWIGPESDDSAKAISLMKTMAMAFRHVTDLELAARIRSGSSTILPGSWLALDAFMKRQYWNRLWILQEIAVGNRSTPLLCGNHSITWGEFYDALYHFSSRYIEIAFSCISWECKEAGIASNGIRRNHIIQLNRQQEILAGLKPTNCLPILDVARQCDVSDPKDRIYGILGMMPPDISDRIVPYYRNRVGEIYLSFARAVISSRKSQGRSTKM